MNPNSKSWRKNQIKSKLHFRRSKIECSKQFVESDFQSFKKENRNHRPPKCCRPKNLEKSEKFCLEVKFWTKIASIWVSCAQGKWTSGINKRPSFLSMHLVLRNASALPSLLRGTTSQSMNGKLLTIP